MAAAKDLTGQRFGRLTVIGLDKEPYRYPSGQPARRWKCRCDCGTELTVLQNALTSKNGTRSCGCARRDTMRKNGHDLTGKRFGRLTVIKSVDLDKPEANGNRRGWMCRCDCGREIVATQKQLELDNLQSCGCLLSDVARDKIVNQNIVGHYNGTTVSAIRPGRKLNKNNKSGVTGVHWNSRENCWIARIGFKGKDIALGRFRDLAAAQKAREEAEKKYFHPIIEEYEKSKTK